MCLFKKRNSNNNKLGKTKINQDQIRADFLAAHAKAWSKISTSAEAYRKISQAKESMNRFLNDDSIDWATREEVGQKVIAILESYGDANAYTGETVSESMAEVLRCAIIGWTSKETNAILCGLTELVQELLTNNSIHMSAEDSKAVLSALMDCRQSAAMRVARNGYDAQREASILEKLQGVKIDLQSNVGAGRILDLLNELNDSLNWVIGGEDIVMPTFSDYNSFRSTVDRALAAFENKLRAVENTVQRIQQDMEAIRITFKSLPENDPRRNALRRKYADLKARAQSCEATANALNDQKTRLATLHQAIQYIGTFVDLTSYSDFTTFFSGTNHTEILSGDRYQQIMTMLDTLKNMHKPTDSVDPEKIFGSVETYVPNDLDDDIMAEEKSSQSQKAAASTLDEDVRAHTL